MIAPPLYVMTTQTLERAEGLAKLNGALSKIKDLIEDAGGVFNIKQAVSVFCVQNFHFVIQNPFRQKKYENK